MEIHQLKHHQLDHERFSKEESNVKGIISFQMGMTLRDGSRQYFYKKLDENFSGLKNKYIKHFIKFQILSQIILKLVNKLYIILL